MPHGALLLVASSAQQQRTPEQLSFSDFDGGEVSYMAELRASRAAIAASARSVNTLRAYGSDWALFCRWCVDHHRPWLPASAETIGLYVAECAAIHRYSTVERRLAAVAYEHHRAGVADPTRAPELRELLRGLRRRLSHKASCAKDPVTVQDLRAMVTAARLQPDPLGQRDAAMLLLGFAGGFRRSELVSLDLSDVGFERSGMVVLLRRSKTDQLGMGRVVAIARGKHEDTCPVRALRAWLAERGKWDGPLFSGMRGPALRRGRMIPQMVAYAIKRAAAAAGLDASRFSGHSLRSGLVTAAHLAGKADSAIMAATGHRSTAMLARYVRADGRAAIASAAARGLL